MRPRLPPFAAALLCSLACAVVARSVAAKTLEVGPGKPYPSVQDTLKLIQPGDVVEVQGDHTYAGDVWFREAQAGKPGAPVTVRGVKVNGKRPVLKGVGTQQYHDMVVLLNASHFVFEGFEIEGDGNPDHSGIVHKANDVTLRDVVVHGVGSHGLLGTDADSGSLLMDRCEFYGNGNGLYDHQIYMATDETAYPGSVFRMQGCYVHDGAGGNNVKSRAERNEIYANWIEGAVYHELDLIGPDGQNESLAREDSDVVGNVLIKHSEWRIARIGGDGTGNTKGRYRFVNNTMILGEQSERAIGMQQTVASVELHNNVVVRLGGKAGRLVTGSDLEGPPPTLVGSHNWVQTGFTDVPAGFTDGFGGTDAGFTDLAKWDLRPKPGSPLLEKGTTATSLAAVAIASPLPLPLLVPPARALGTDAPRPTDATPDIGAFELGAGAPPGMGGSGGTAAGGGGTGTAGSGTGGSGAGTGGTGTAGSGTAGSGAGTAAGGAGMAGTSGNGSAGTAGSGTGTAGTSANGGAGTAGSGAGTAGTSANGSAGTAASAGGAKGGPTNAAGAGGKPAGSGGLGGGGAATQGSASGDEGGCRLGLHGSPSGAVVLAAAVGAVVARRRRRR